MQPNGSGLLPVYSFINANSRLQFTWIDLELFLWRFSFSSSKYLMKSHFALSFCAACSASLSVYNDWLSYSCWRRSEPYQQDTCLLVLLWTAQDDSGITSAKIGFTISQCSTRTFLSKIGVVINRPSGSCLRKAYPCQAQRQENFQWAMTTAFVFDCEYYMNTVRFIGVFITW